MPLYNVVTLKVWIEDNDGLLENKCYKVKNGKEIIEMELCSGDKLLIDGIGNLEILGLHYKDEIDGTHPYRSLEIICGLITNNIV